VLLADHVDRLGASAAALGLEGLPAREDLLSAGRALADGAAPGVHRMRIVFARGSAAVVVEPFGGYPPEIYETGVAAAVSRRAGHPLGPRAGHKVIPYTPLMKLRREARNRGAFERIFRDRDGALLEGCASSLFVALGGKLATPPLSRPILPGVTRAAVIRIARDLGIDVEERDVWPEEIPEAREAFLTGSLMEVVPLSRLGHTFLPPGPLARLLLEKLRSVS
jgi:branched-subunit amino acid aminotransferase/4-amino-4-deoxychorismate lyase